MAYLSKTLLEINPTTLSVTFFRKLLSKLNLAKNCSKVRKKGKKKIENQSSFDKTLDLDNSVEKKRNKKNVLVLYSTLYCLSNDTTDNPIDWPNLTERKKETRRNLKFAGTKILLAKH